MFHSLKIILGWKNKKCYLKLFYKFFASNLLKLLEKFKTTESPLHFFGVAPLFRSKIPRKSKSGAMN